MQLNTLSMVHDFLTRTVKPGSICVDATAGKGRDTALLCRLTGKAGRVLAFDIQEEAIRQTRALLEAEGLSAEVVLDSHANLEQYAEPGTVDCVVFNFGRLPSGDPAVFTRAETSVAALEASLRVLKPGGRLVVISYHSLEDRLVKNFMRSGNFSGQVEKDFFGRSQAPFDLVTRKAVTPSAEELDRNPRSRSAKLRAAVKR